MEKEALKKGVLLKAKLRERVPGHSGEVKKEVTIPRQ